MSKSKNVNVTVTENNKSSIETNKSNVEDKKLITENNESSTEIEHSYESCISLIAKKAPISEIKNSFLNAIKISIQEEIECPTISENGLNELKIKIDEIERSDPSDFKDSFAYLAFILRTLDSLSDNLRDEYYTGILSYNVKHRESEINHDREFLIKLHTVLEKIFTKQVNFTGKIQNYTTFVKTASDSLINNLDVLNDIMIQGFQLSAASNDIAKDIMLESKKLHDYLNIK